MNKSDYQSLRFAVECHVAQFIPDAVVARDLVNLLMRKFVTAMADSQIKQAASKRVFVTFRRDKQTAAPSWAYQNPGIGSRLPKL